MKTPGFLCGGQVAAADDWFCVKTVRFAHVVKTRGKPQTYLVFSDPKKDRTFQTAVKGNRVMTVFQPTTGTQADRGEVGFHPGPARQFLIFPKSLRAYAGHKVVGIKYEILGEAKTSEGKGESFFPGRWRQGSKRPAKKKVATEPEEPSKKTPKPKVGKPRKAKAAPKRPAKRTQAAVAPKAAAPTSRKKATGKAKATKKAAATTSALSAKIIPFAVPSPAGRDSKEDDAEVAALKKEIRHALELLEAGKQVAAFNRLQKALE